MKRCYKTCKWYDNVMGLCYNWKSPHLADKTDPKQRCCEWERKEADMDKPRICEVLGVEVNEEFTYDFGENQVNRGTFKIGADGKRYYKAETETWNPCYNEDDLTVIINHPDRIIRKPCFTQQEVEDAKYTKRILKVDYVRRNIYGNGLVAMKSDNSVSVVINSEMFPSIQPGKSYTLDEIIGGAE